jgi:hypothetical protein
MIAPEKFAQNVARVRKLAARFIREVGSRSEFQDGEAPAVAESARALSGAACELAISIEQALERAKTRSEQV